MLVRELLFLYIPCVLFLHLTTPVGAVNSVDNSTGKPECYNSSCKDCDDFEVADHVQIGCDW